VNFERDKPGLRPQLEPDIYFQPRYLTKKRFITYWHQIDEAHRLGSNTILEIGPGNRFVTDCLRRMGRRVNTLDIDYRLSPDCAGSVTDIPFRDSAFEVVICVEVLEHLPFHCFTPALKEIRRVSSTYAVISIPDYRRAYRIDIQVPRIGNIKKLIGLPRLKKPAFRFNGEHFWEIGRAGYPLQTIIRGIQDAGFDIKRHYRVFENPYHHFFILKKVSDR
jgi:hypothetical protein